MARKNEVVENTVKTVLIKVEGYVSVEVDTDNWESLSEGVNSVMTDIRDNLKALGDTGESIFKGEIQYVTGKRIKTTIELVDDDE